MKVKVCAFTSSLRNARSGKGAVKLVEQLKDCRNQQMFDKFLAGQAGLRLEQFMLAGRNEGKPYDELYKELKKLSGDKGLSNSEVAVAAALWGAWRQGAEIELCPLTDYFMATGKAKKLDQLKRTIMEADGLILGTPVYFGDRSSLCQNLIEFIRGDEDLRRAARDKVVGGVSVGAKRNGGQETTLIYQLLDMMNNGFMGVGNDFKTTSQYGGTCHAGDVGSIAKDKYGVGTCIGTGNRVARVASLLRLGADGKVDPPPSMGFWILQDRDGFASDLLSPIIAGLAEAARVEVVSMEKLNIRRCMACDICPTRVGPDEEYRCLTTSKNDDMHRLHTVMLKTEIIVPVVYSTRDREGLLSNYQLWMERTRYLRRGDYVFTNRLVVPLVFEELGAAENIHIRMITSLIRHHTVMHEPIIGWLHKGRLLNAGEVGKKLASAAEVGGRILCGRFRDIRTNQRATTYKPVGYVLSEAKDNTRETLKAREQATNKRIERLTAESLSRLG